MLLGVAYHAAYAWFPDVGRWYFVADASPVPDLVFFVGFAHAWRMQLFFALSGFFANLVFERRGGAEFLRDRARRLVPPLLAALPVTVLVDWLVRRASHAQGLMSADYEAGAAFRFIPLHLWFLIYLFTYCLAAWALPKAAWPAKVMTYALQFPPVLLLFAVPTYLGLQHHPENRPDQFFWPMPYEWLHYGGFFLCGWLLWSARAHVARLTDWAPLFLLAGVGLGVQIYSGSLQWQPEGQTAAGLVAWLLTLGGLGLGFRWQAGGAAALRFLTDASYWVYLAHYPLILALQLFFAARALDGRLEYALTVLGCTALLLALYAQAVRGRAWARRLGISR